MSDFRTPEEKHPTFEATYPRYEFSELVRIGLVLAAWIARRRGPRPNALHGGAVLRHGAHCARDLSRRLLRASRAPG